MLLGWIRKIRLRRVARLYAQRLKPQLFKSFGAGEVFTSGQIIAAIRAAKLPEEHIEIGYAAFLTQDDFCAQTGDQDVDRYIELRSLYRTYLPHGLSSAYGQPEDSGYTGSGPLEQS